MFKSNKKLVSLVFILFLAVLSLGFTTFQSYKTDTFVFAKIPENITPIPTVVVPGPIKKDDMDSPDGTMTLSMESQQTDREIKYSFFTSVKSESDRQLIFEKEIDVPKNLSIPYNTWSPDNKFLFLKQTSPFQIDYFVFFADGKDFSEGSHYLEIQDLFEQKVKDFVIEDVTGWSSPNLLLVNTKEIEGDKKASFWFDVYSKSFIRLSTYFR